MKKLALLLVLTIVLSFSSVFATDTAANPNAIAPVVSGEVTNTNENAESDENIAPESGEIANTTSGDVSGETSAEHDHDHDNNVATQKTTVWGAVLAIVIVIIVVALVAMFSKND